MLKLPHISVPLPLLLRLQVTATKADAAELEALIAENAPRIDHNAVELHRKSATLRYQRAMLNWRRHHPDQTERQAKHAFRWSTPYNRKLAEAYEALGVDEE